MQDGIAVVEPRAAEPVRVIREDEAMPLPRRTISLPATGQPQRNRLSLVEGRWIWPA